jgi:hypothetical protein
MIGPILALVALSLSLAWALFLRAGVYPSDWASTVVFVGCTCLVYWMFVRRRRLAPKPALWVRCAIWALPCYCFFQLLPLPLGLLGAISPARAQLAATLAPVVAGISSAPISVNPPQALVWTFSIITYIATFFLVRELSWRFAERPFITLLPLVVLGTGEALIGIFQVSFGWATTGATGTYASRNHFSGFLEMILPITLMAGWSSLQDRMKGWNESIMPVVRACLFWGASALLLAAISSSLSRMGFFVALFTLFVMGALSFGPRLPSQNFRAISLTVLAVGILALFILLPPDQLIMRFAEMAAGGNVSSETRLYFWKGTLAIINEFRWFGTGLGGFEATFLKHQNVVSAYRIEMADNDYLQYLAELGFIGFAILITAVVGVLIPVIRGISKVTDEKRRLFLVAGAGSFIAIGLHSIVDFNLYIPANAMTLAWIAGAASVSGLD